MKVVNKFEAASSKARDCRLSVSFVIVEICVGFSLSLESGVPTYIEQPTTSKAGNIRRKNQRKIAFIYVVITDNLDYATQPQSLKGVHRTCIVEGYSGITLMLRTRRKSWSAVTMVRLYSKAVAAIRVSISPMRPGPCGRLRVRRISA